MALTPLQIILGKTAAIIGAVQGFAWWGMALACVIVYYDGTEIPKDDPTNFSQLLSRGLQLSYLVKNSEVGTSDKRVIQASDLIILAWMYLFASIVWIVISVDQFLAIHWNKSRQSTLMISWGTLTICISVVDLVFSSLLLRDFINCSTSNLACHVIIGTVMTIAARGYTLWLLNCVLAISTILSGVNIITREKILKSSMYGVEIPRAKATPSQTNTLEHNPRQLHENSNYSPQPSSNGYLQSQNLEPPSRSLGAYPHSPSLNSVATTGFSAQLRNGNRFNY
ncbi:uncharacterized protein LOC126892951 isoform X3 [Diabrotica virgifera virgifera]|uniref:Transmembrane protein n=1 Tax=Diabrotica virgifera virgifera TaxID=50390 RepID=A0ABM5L8T5_DIAVI|nr:uncharacterized protein LOC126892951 isoform X3 [Diabrotica virgifera virgifera]